MSFRFVTYATSAQTDVVGSVLTFNNPAGNGQDLLVMALSFTVTVTGNYTLPTGWVSKQHINLGANPLVFTDINIKTVTGNDPATETITFSDASPGGLRCVVARYRLTNLTEDFTWQNSATATTVNGVGAVSPSAHICVWQTNDIDTTIAVDAALTARVKYGSSADFWILFGDERLTSTTVPARTMTRGSTPKSVNSITATYGELSFSDSWAWP